MTSTDLQAIRESVRKLAEKRIPEFQNEAWHGTLPRELFSEFAELGLAGLTLPEQYGGLDLGPLAAQAVLEEISRVDLGPAIFLSVHWMVGGLIKRFASEPQRARYLTKFASGEWLGAFGLTESSAGSDAAALKTTARRDRNDYVLNGSKCWITSAGFAEVYLVFAKTDPERGKDGISAFLVHSDTPGFSWGKPEKKMGCELSPISTLAFDEARVPAEQLIGELGRGYRVALGGLAGGRINIAACANGLSRSAIEIASSSLQEREQFGTKLITFQGLQFMLADMVIKRDAAQLLTERAAAEMEQNPDSKDNRLHPSIAKCFATDAAMEITTDAVQLLGGAGYAHEYKVERLMRDAKMLQIVEGTNQIQRLVIAREFIAQR